MPVCLPRVAIADGSVPPPVGGEGSGLRRRVPARVGFLPAAGWWLRCAGACGVGVGVGVFGVIIGDVIFGFYCVFLPRHPLEKSAEHPWRLGSDTAKRTPQPVATLQSTRRGQPCRDDTRWRRAVSSIIAQSRCVDGRPEWTVGAGQEQRTRRATEGAGQNKDCRRR